MKKELYGILLFFFIILTAVSLFSFHAADPSVGNDFFTIPDKVHNLFGLVGAHTAGLFVYLFGIGSLWVPLVLSLLGLWYLKEKSARVIWLTLLGGLILMISTGSIFYLFKDGYHFSNTIMPAGGVIGKWLTGFLLKYANITGCVIILIFFVMIGFTLVTGLSLKDLARFAWDRIVNLGQTIRNDLSEAFDYTRNRIYQFREDRKAARLERAQKLEEMAAIPQETETDADFIENTQSAVPVSVPTVMDEPDPPKKSRIKKPEKQNEEDQSLDDLFAPNIVEVKTDDKEYLADPLVKDIREQPDFILPKLNFLDEKTKIRRQIDTDGLQSKARILESKLNDFNVKGEVVEILPGPVITTFEYRPAPGIKLSKIVGLSDDLALALSAISIRIVAPIPGRDVVGIEIPNEERELVNLREMVSSKEFVQSASLLTLGLGKDLLGQPVATKMDKMPHLLIAGATGTGKSVGLNSMIISLLYKATPDEVKLIMVDPKRIELSVYNDIPHLITPVVTDMKKATNALFWAVREMERRYELLEMSGLRNIGQYNEMVQEKLEAAGAEGVTEEDASP
ncbi:MAG: DNA translocase FtsK 4TM domain-containing protein, partial [Desulfobacterales bacterium]|nr:DNA translocase FtsK 4TM domain-containing protein [Desulfobacterales bacterium]